MLPEYACTNTHPSALTYRHSLALVRPDHHRSHRPRTMFIFTCIAAVLMLLLALSVGRFSIGVRELASTVFSALFGTTSAAPENADVVLFEIRGPRVLAAFVVGGVLAAAGAAYQNLFRNPLVSPDILGVSSGAALGAVLAIFIGLSPFGVQALAFAGGLCAVALIFRIGRTIRGHDPVLSLVLCGVVVGSLLGSGITLSKYLADPYDQLPTITYWLLGSFASLGRRELFIALPLMLAALLPLWALRWRINFLSLPDDEARALGQNLSRLRLAVIISATLMTAAAVAICGIVGWVGLIVPHAVRLLVGDEFSRVLPLSFLIGGTFMLAIDTLCRTIAPVEIPPGVLTAALGSPAFIWLMARKLRQPA